MSSSSDNPSKTDTADFKAKLDEAARQASNPPKSEPESESQVPKIVKKVAQYIPEPIHSKVLGRSSPQQQENNNPPPVPESVPPKRPEHDPHIEEFIRDQHRSTGLKLEE
ncbi:hypothetical protein V8F06_004647 [Rhypophila decipiens]